MMLGVARPTKNVNEREQHGKGAHLEPCYAKP